MKEALGLLEVTGMLQAILVADIALKSANVKLLQMQKVKGGLVCVVLEGDVSAITVAIDVVRASAPANMLLSHHMIARPDEQTLELLDTKKSEDKADSALPAEQEELAISISQLIESEESVVPEVSKKEKNKANRKKS